MLESERPNQPALKDKFKWLDTDIKPRKVIALV
jgi:hypothetical protein